MEARATFREASVSKTFVATIAVIAAMCLAAAGGYVARGLSASDQAAVQAQSVHAAPGTVLRQDNPAKIESATFKVDDYLRELGYRGGASVVTPAEPRSTGHKELP